MTIGESIKQLLEERKRVILPGFGNLELKESGGGISSSSKRIDPPGLIIRFDSSFSKDDGVLSTAFAEAGGVNKEEAEQQVLELVDAIRFALDKGEPYSLNDAGIFRRDDEGKIHFEPNPSWVLEPDQYGLGSMDLLELEDLPVEEVEASGISSGTNETGQEEESVADAGPLLELSEEEEIEPEKKPVAKLVTRRSKKPFSAQVSKTAEPQKNEKTKRRLSLWRLIWLITGVLIVVLVALLLIPKQPQQPVQSEKPAIKPEVSDQAAPASEQVKPAMIELEPEPEPVQVLEQTNHFFIVAGSFKNLVNASELQDKLKARGYPAELMITENRMYRVSVANYPTIGEAERNLTRIKSEPGMESCWLLSNE